MKKILVRLGFNIGNSSIALDKAEKTEFESLLSKRFNDLDTKNKHRTLELGAKDFSNKFSGVIEELSRE